MNAEKYVGIIMRDDTEKFVRETPKIYEPHHIVREYEFEDGAIVTYEWRDTSFGDFNHQFTLIQAPNKNPDKLKPGIIKTISY
ncbi:MAG: hypothetical protein IT174_05145 [Acidobacteria bacterium]|nr:hypothetical protein [Acidobacteriota bacterium]